MKKIIFKIKHKTRVRTRAKAIVSKSKSLRYVYKNDGFRGVVKTVRDVSRRELKKRKSTKGDFIHQTGDILIVSINDSLLDRYRSDHMMEGLQTTGAKVDKIYYFELTKQHIKHYNVFIFYRVPWLPVFKELFESIDQKNKVAIYAIDDLVIDTKYTNQIPAVKKMQGYARELYDEGVNRHKKVLEHCQYAIATTQVIADELKNFKNLKKIFIDRNAMSEEMVFYANEAIKNVKKEQNKLIIGYFSGTNTHNEDFKMIAPALISLLKENSNIYIKLAGKIEVPKILKDYKDRIISTPYVDWRKLPAELVKCDIILSPLQDTLFNRAKSEIKWSEASLVKVPVVASNVGALKEILKHKKTAILVNNTSKEWYEGIKILIDNKNLRTNIAEQANDYVLKNCRTTGNHAIRLRKFVKGVKPRVIAFAGINISAISGGNLVVKKHMDLLREAGNIVYGVEIMEYQNGDRWTKINQADDKKYDIFRINSHRSVDKVDLKMHFDRFVATFWASVDMVDEYKYMKKGGKKLYLVQNMEAEFYANNDKNRLSVLATYRNHRLQPITISKWCQAWLKEDFDKEAKYAPNGIDLDLFVYKKRDWTNRKVKILIEGDSASDYKRVDESFKITNQLDRSKFEVSYLSYNAKPKDWYKVDNSYIEVPYSEVGNIYQQHDILLKSSVLESFSYPPLEMMSTGGVPVLVKNDGNAEYVVDGVNAIYYQQGNTADAINKIESLASDQQKFNEIAKNGHKTAEARAWDKVKHKIIKLYE